MVGDLHGCDGLLERLLEIIDEDHQGDPTSYPVRLVFVGDYVDRGERSAKVVGRLIELVDDPSLQVTCLKGNHEELMLSFLTDAPRAAGWLDHGGMETLASYGVPQPLRRRRERDFDGLAADLAARIGAHRAFLDALPLSYRSGNIMICHAGVSPDRALSAQDPSTLLWGDERFLEAGGPSDMVIVHGHWACERVDFGPNRVGVDTGAYLSQRLSALRIDPQRGYRTLST